MVNLKLSNIVKMQILPQYLFQHIYVLFVDVVVFHLACFVFVVNIQVTSFVSIVNFQVTTYVFIVTFWVTMFVSVVSFWVITFVFIVTFWEMSFVFIVNFWVTTITRNWNKNELFCLKMYVYKILNMVFGVDRHALSTYQKLLGHDRIPLRAEWGPGEFQ